MPVVLSSSIKPFYQECPFSLSELAETSFEDSAMESEFGEAFYSGFLKKTMVGLLTLNTMRCSWLCLPIDESAARDLECIGNLVSLHKKQGVNISKRSRISVWRTQSPRNVSKSCTQALARTLTRDCCDSWRPRLGARRLKSTH